MQVLSYVISWQRRDIVNEYTTIKTIEAFIVTVNMLTLQSQMLSFLLLLGTGFLFMKARLVTKAMLDQLSKLLMTIILPIMIITTLPGAAGDGTAKMFVPMVVGSFGLFAVLALGGLAGSMILCLRGDQRRVHIGESMFGNLGFFGIPLASELFGAPGTLALSLFAIADNILLWTVGVVLSSHGGAQGANGRISLKQSLRKLVNPATLSVAAGLILLVLRVPADTPVLRSLAMIGGCAKPLALFYIGATIGGMSFRGMLPAWPAFGIVGIKMIATPLALYYLLTSVFTGLPIMAVQCLTLIACLPSMATLPIMAKENGSLAHEYGAQAVIITTVSSVFTIPLVMMLL